MSNKKDISTKNRHIASLNNIVGQLENYLGLDLYNPENKKYRLQPITKCVQGVADEYKRLSIKDKKVMVTKLTNGVITFNALAVGIYASQDTLVSFKNLPENRTIYDILTAMQTNSVISNYRKKVVKCLHSILARTDNNFVNSTDEMSYRLLRILFILLVIEQTKITPLYTRGLLALYEDGQGLIGEKTSLRLTKSTIDAYCDKLEELMRKQQGQVTIKKPVQTKQEPIKVNNPVETKQEPIRENIPVSQKKNSPVVKIKNKNTQAPTIKLNVEESNQPANKEVAHREQANAEKAHRVIINKKPQEPQPVKREQPKRKVIVSSNGTRLEETAKMEVKNPKQNTNSTTGKIGKVNFD